MLVITHPKPTQLLDDLLSSVTIDTCDFGHKFAKLPDHPQKNNQARCPYCMAEGLDALRFIERT